MARCIAAPLSLYSRGFCALVGIALLTLRTRAVRTVLWWQLSATGVIAAIAAPWLGVHGALSAALGGMINVAASLAYFGIASLGPMPTAGATVRRLVRAESTKISIIVIALYFALTHYEAIAPVPFFCAFILTALLPSVVFLVREDPYHTATPR